MGQPVRLVGKRRINNVTLRYEIDRSLTGQAHEFYETAPSARSADDRPDRTSDLLARRLFATDHVSSVHVFSNLITISVDEVEVAEPMVDEAIEEMFIHYIPGVLPTPIPVPEPAAASESGATS